MCRRLWCFASLFSFTAREIQFLLPKKKKPHVRLYAFYFSSSQLLCFFFSSFFFFIFYIKFFFYSLLLLLLFFHHPFQQIDQLPEVMTVSPNGFWHLSLPHSLYLGGSNNAQYLPLNLKELGSFVGCIQKVSAVVNVIVVVHGVTVVVVVVAA